MDAMSCLVGDLDSLSAHFEYAVFLAQIPFLNHLDSLLSFCFECPQTPQCVEIELSGLDVFDDFSGDCAGRDRFFNKTSKFTTSSKQSWKHYVLHIANY